MLQHRVSPDGRRVRVMLSALASLSIAVMVSLNLWAQETGNDGASTDYQVRHVLDCAGTLVDGTDWYDSSTSYRAYHALGQATTYGEFISSPAYNMAPGYLYRVFDVAPLTTPWSRQLQVGWNAVSLAVQPPAGYSALDLYYDIVDDGGDPGEIYRWYAGGWQALLVEVSGSPLELYSVDLVSGAGYMVRCTASSAWSLEGTLVASPVPLAIGWNFVSVPSWADNQYGSLAIYQQIVADGGNPREIYRWFAGGWGVLLVENANGDPIEIDSTPWRSGHAYMVYSQASSTWTVGN